MVRTRMEEPKLRAFPPLRFESDPGLGLDDCQEISNVQVAVELCLFFRRQGSSFRPLRQVKHPAPVTK